MEIERLTETGAISDCLDIIERFAEESPFGISMDRALAHARILHLLNGMMTEFFVARDETGVIGILGAMAVPDIISAETKAQELCWYVHPDHRGGSAAIRLFAEFERWAINERGATRLIMTALADSPGVVSFYERRGYRLIESNYLKSV